MLYVIQVRATSEHRIQSLCEKFLLHEGDEMFIPTYDRQMKFHGEFKTVRKILFPGYIFVRTSDTRELYFKLKTIPHLTKLLRVDDFFLPVSREEEIRIEELGGESHHVGVSVGVIVGDEVKVLSGPLENFRGPIRYIDRHKRLAYVGLDLLGTEHRIPIGLEIVSKIPASLLNLEKPEDTVLPEDISLPEGVSLPELLSTPGFPIKQHH